VHSMSHFCASRRIRAARVPNDLGPVLIKNGALDGNGHSYVGLMVAQDNSGNPHIGLIRIAL